MSEATDWILFGGRYKKVSYFDLSNSCRRKDLTTGVGSILSFKIAMGRVLSLLASDATLIFILCSQMT